MITPEQAQRSAETDARIALQRGGPSNRARRSWTPAHWEAYERLKSQEAEKQRQREEAAYDALPQCLRDRIENLQEQLDAALDRICELERRLDEQK